MLPRRFVLQRDIDDTGISGVGVVAHGVQFPDGTVCMHWCAGVDHSTVVWDNIAQVERIHGHGGNTTIEWIDL